MADISTLTNVSSGAIRNAEKATSNVTNPVGKVDERNTFSKILSSTIDNINTTNAYLSDAENAEIEWALGQSDNTHDLTIALNKAQTALQYTVAIRDRVLTAYNQLMQMQF
ncbi:MAG: flagellar hook-basal body complex protein FliE [Butyrivibrio sp.]|uniref:flagellar hook-basal body complex protein FliE n=1 Tax=Butyrivibrio sp. TaxID=28121 RepID=UPI0025CF0773|nr:flagellar hook-basal body complex protein FliE [Butyrivibrio sp.]MCR5772248.1 flagellar hook-basal body complex protein FliE [Butyrivibrio sp.]